MPAQRCLIVRYPTRSRVFAGLATAVVVSLAVTVGTTDPVSARPARPTLSHLVPQKEAPVPGRHRVPLPYAPDPAAAHARPATPAAAAWPSPGEATIDVPGASATAPARKADAVGQSVRAGALPVRVAAAAAGRMQVQVLNRATVPAAWRDAVLLRVGRAPAPSAATSSVDAGVTRLSVDYSRFRNLFGGDWSNRLQLLALPACALTTPGARPCQATALPSTNDPSAGTVTADVGLGGSGIFAVAAGASGSTGSFAATSLSPSGAWSAGGSSGDFNWSYALRVPPALGGPAPTVSLSYSAQSVDGEMAATNNQPSWAGEGFQLATGGYIERRYKSCADDMGGGANNTTKTGDECWGTDNATMSLNGSVVELIKDGATGAWHPRTDDGSKIEHLSGAANGDDNGEYWKVTTAGGTQYWFGLNRLPGWTSGKPVTNSTWTVPVFGNNPGEPCYQATFDASYCTQAWRWNLDYVVDPHGNSMSYHYATENNEYARDIDSTKVSTYVRGGYLSEIDYGTRTEAEFGFSPARVLFNAGDRCVPGSTCDSAHPSSWPDVPWDQVCTGATCTQYSPTFFSTKRLASVKTQVWNAPTMSYRDVESWTLTHSFPDPGDGTRAGLWLSKIGHQGLAAGTTTVPDITFTGVQMANRVDGIDASPAMNWWRVASIRNETGGEISVQYSPPDCTAGSHVPAAPESNTLRCYPVYWTPAGYTAPMLDWFQKYVVSAVAEVDHTGGAPRVLTTYTYVGAPAWHYTDDDGLLPASQKTWSVWRGYGTVDVTKGDTGEQSSGETRYFRGMDGDHLPSGTRSVGVTDTRGGTFTDSDPYAGQVREQITYNGPGGAAVSETLSDPWMSDPTGTRTINGVAVSSRYVNTSVDSQRIALDGARGWMTTKTVTTFDSYGMAATRTDYGDTGKSGDEQCTTYSYARNTSAWLMSYTSRILTYAGTCDQAPTSAGDVIGDARTSYDGQAAGAAPTKGDITRVEALKSWSNGATTYLTTARSSYDSYGRVSDAWDIDGNHTTTSYTPASGGPVTQTRVTNPLGWATVTDLNPAWGATTGVTDQNGRRTDITYDGLGRTTAVWLPGRDKATQTANTTYAYGISTTAPSVVTTAALNANGTYTTSYALYDGLLRSRQNQAPAIGSTGAQVTDTYYDTAGRPYKANGPYIVSAAPSGTLFTPTGDSAIPAQTLTLYDGADRATATILRSLGTEKWRTTTVYGGDHQDVIPPAGGLASSTVIDARNRPVKLLRYHGAAASGAYDTTTYTYNAKNLPATVVDTAGNTWRYGYDVRGRRTSVTDPDKGPTTTAYDDAGRVLSTTDARGQTLAYTYDALSRKTAEFAGSVSGTKLAAWTYDTLAEGQPTASTRYVDGNAYTTAVLGYTTAYQPTGTSITIPATEGALAGTYKLKSTYNVDGSLSTVTLPVTGDLAQETVGYDYANTGQPTALSGTTTYITDAQYTQLGEPGTITYSAGGQLAQTKFSYDEATRRLLRVQDVKSTAPATISDQTLTWTPAGDLISIADAASGSTGDTQCFTYDDHRRLAQAWTPASGDCTSAVTTAGLGGPAPYWQTFTYDAVGDRSSRTDHSSAAGGTDSTTSYTYPAPGSPQPHSLLSTTTTDSTGTKTVTYGYDAAGNTVTRPSGTGVQSTTWDAEGNPASVSDTASAGTSSFVYDADGSRLIRHDANGSTLYLPGEELRTTSSGSATCTRYYTFGGSVVAQRTATALTWLMPDRQGSGQIAVAADSQAVTEHRQKPFGEPRGPAVTWPNEHGFVGGTTDPDGLTHLGARDYDPSTGRFTAADPVFNGADQGQMLNYAYSANSPVTNSDPSGQTYGCDSQSHEMCGSPGMGPSGCGDCHDDSPPSGSTTPTSTNSSAGPTGDGGSPPDATPAPTNPSPPSNCFFWCGVTQTFHAAVNWVDQNKAQIAGFVTATVVGIGCGVAIGWTGVGALACGFVAGAAGSLVTDLVEGGHSLGSVVGDTLLGGAMGLLGAAGGELLGAGLKAVAPGLKAVAGKVLGNVVTDVEDVGSAEVGNGLKAADCVANSFAPGTAVLMADGRTKAIADVKTGDKVEAADPVTDTPSARQVTATIAGLGVRQLVDVSVATNSSHGSAAITATDGHPFWVVNRHAWVPAGELRPNDQLVTRSGSTVTVSAVRHYKAYQQVYNLSVAGLHTYYVLASTTPVLVHNCGSVSTEVATSGAHEPVPLYRNVDAAEFNSIADTKRFEIGQGSMEGKWFATQGEHAEQWGRALNNDEGITVQTTIPRWLADQLHPHLGKLDGIGPAMYADVYHLGLVNKHMSGITLWP